MYCLESDLSAKAYLSALRSRGGVHFSLMGDHLNGFVIGPFFSVAYHSPYEWNRRITRECNRAWGYVKEVDGKTEVYFIRGKGLFSPFWLIFLALAFLTCLMIGLHDVPDLTGEIPVLLLVSAIFSLILCGITAFHSTITEAGEEGAGVITMLLKAPDEFYYC